jgi:hypothetical protein
MPAAVEDPLLNGDLEPGSGNSAWRYFPLASLVCMQAVSFGYTLAFTAGTIGKMVDDIGFCGKQHLQNSFIQLPTIAMKPFHPISRR